MKLASKIFKRDDYKLTSKFGYRKLVNSNLGEYTSFHTGSDYGTNGEKWPQYALEDGKVERIFVDDYGAKCVWIKYPRLNIRVLHAHLDKIIVTDGMNVDENTLIGYTGKTGKSTGIHLHLGLKDADSNKWLDPENYNYVRNSLVSNDKFLGSRGYLKEGDKGENIHKICLFFVNNFYGYFGNSKESARIKLLGYNNDGNYFGPYLKKWVVEFQKRAKEEGIYNDVLDGNIGPLTLKALENYGFKY